MATHVDRIAAAALTMKPLRLLLSILAFPFYALGWLVGLLLVAATWVVAAVQVGVSDARGRRPGGSDVAS